MFAKLAQDGWITTADADLWCRIVAFRNIAVHRYLQVDVAVVRKIAEDHLDDLLGFASAVRRCLVELR